MRDGELARFADINLGIDEALAQAAASVAGPDWDHQVLGEATGQMSAYLCTPDGTPLADLMHVNDEELGPHLAEHDPARVLREAEAKRRILARHAACPPECLTLRDLVSAWCHRPGYREEWTP